MDGFPTCFVSTPITIINILRQIFTTCFPTVLHDRRFMIFIRAFMFHLFTSPFSKFVSAWRFTIIASQWVYKPFLLGIATLLAAIAGRSHHTAGSGYKGTKSANRTAFPRPFRPLRHHTVNWNGHKGLNTNKHFSLVAKEYCKLGGRAPAFTIPLQSGLQ